MAEDEHLTQTDMAAVSVYLDKAWNYLRLNAGDRYLPDVISLADVVHDWPGFKEALLLRVQQGHYSPAYIEVIDFPKDALNVRPLTRFTLEDRLIYEACLFAIAPKLDSVIPSEVYSYRWSKFKQRLYSPKGRWVKMQERARLIHAREQAYFMLRTDISAFYEYIDLDILYSELRGLGLPPWSIKLLTTFLSGFNSSTNAWGLPQGPDSSGFLANLYLLPIDNLLRQQKLKHLRYSDDLMVFASSWLELRSILARINQICRSRHLTLSSPKTKIIAAADVPREFEDVSKDAVRYGIDIGSPGSADELHGYFDEAASNYNLRDIRFSLNQLLRLSDDWAVSWLLTEMPSLPHLAEDAVIYLRHFRLRRTEIDSEISAMLADGVFSFYPSVERRVIHYLRLEVVSDLKALSACWAILSDSNKSQIVREFAARYVGYFCAPGDGARLRELFEREPSDYVRRALLVAYYEAGDYSRQFLASISTQPSFLGRTARYLQTHPEAIPCPDMEVVW